MPKRSTLQQVPKDLQARFDETTHLTDAFAKGFIFSLALSAIVHVQ